MRVHFVVLLFLLLTASAVAQEVVNVRVTNNAMLIPVRVNDRELLFMLDTGSERSAIDPSLAAPLDLKSIGEVQLLRNYRVLKTSAAQARKLGIGTKLFEHQSLATFSMQAASRALGVNVDGILGNDILQELSFKLNYSKPELILGPLSKLGSMSSPITLRRSGDQFFIPLHAMSVPVELLLDTGSNSTNLSWGTWRELSQRWTPGSIVDGVVRSGVPTPPAFLVCIPKVSVGDITLPDQVVRVQRTVETGAFSEEHFGGILGSDVLREFEITFDLKHDRIFLQKDARFTPDAYRYTTIGVQFARNDQGDYSIMSVWKNSPADEAGLTIGDQIKMINGEAAVSMSPEQLSGRLHGEEGTRVNLRIEREGKSSALTLRTRRMLCTHKSKSRADRIP
jgi:hypothetical protein